MNLFTEISVIIILVIVISLIVRLLKQPLIMGYIIAGLLAGPFLLNIVSMNEAFIAFSQVGVALLLFIVGLGLNPKLIKEVGKVALLAGLGQVLLTLGLGFLLLYYGLNFSALASLYLSLALALSSTVIVVKLLSDKNTLETLYGRMAIGILLIQDLVAIAALMLISASAQGLAQNFFSVFTLLLVIKGIMALLAFFLLGYYILPRWGTFLAKSQEFLFVFSLGWCLALAAFFQWLGFSIEIGALIAGITLSMTPYHHEISSKVKPLRDFFLILFFIVLGSQMELANLQGHWLAILLLTGFVLLLKPLLIFFLIGRLGYTKRNGFITGITLAQVSEFSFILIAAGISSGHLQKEILSVLTLTGLLSIAGSTYFILYAEKIYAYLSPYLSWFERKGQKKDEYKIRNHQQYDLILLGHNRIGYDVLKSIKDQHKKCLVVDFNPNTIIELTKNRIPCLYGDAGDVELLNQLNFAKVKMVISTIPDPDTNLLLINHIKQRNPRIIIIVIAHQIDDAMKFYDEGATYVLMPHFVGGSHISELIERYNFDVKKFLDEKIKHISYLQSRKKLGHEHPRGEKFR